MLQSDRNATAQTRARQVEQVVDHPRHPQRDTAQAARDFMHVAICADLFKQVCRRQDRVERAAQVVADDTDEQFVEAQGGAQLTQQTFAFFLRVVQANDLQVEFTSLAVQLDEDRDLAAQHVRFDRLQEVVDSAGLVALKHTLVVARPGGDEDDRHASCALGAPHQFGEFKTVHPGHLHVEQRQTDVVNEQQFKGFFARLRREDLDLVRLEQRTHRQQVFLKVVDDENLGGR